tara:strand:- start:118 stop:360 length:243 start_codon:yes stop_codon:yes gene_type:complete
MKEKTYINIKIYIRYFELSDKCLKMIESCETFNHLDIAEKYCELALKVIPEKHQSYYIVEFLNAISIQKEKIVINMSKLN